MIELQLSPPENPTSGEKTGLIKRLIARLRGDRTPVEVPPAPPSDDRLQAILERIAFVETTVATWEAEREAWADRLMRWNEMNEQLRRYLGRLDAHAGHARRREEEEGVRSHGAARLDVIAAKYPQGIPTKGG